MHMNYIIQIEQVVFMYLRMCVCNNINEKRRHKFESNQGKVYGKIWREEGNDAIML